MTRTRPAPRSMSLRPHRLFLLAPLLWAAATTVHAQSCSFNSVPNPLGFGTLDPSNASTSTAFTVAQIKCVPAGSTSPVWSLTGANGNSPLRMKHATRNAYIPYTVTLTQTSGQGSNQDWRLTARVLASDYQNAFAGDYTDQLVVRVTP